jgi:hypothetical protein
MMQKNATTFGGAKIGKVKKFLFLNIVIPF